MSRNAIAGGVLWIAFTLAVGLKAIPLGAIEVLFLLAVLVTVPLGLDLVSRILPEKFAFPLAVARWLQPGAALFAAGSFRLAQGMWAAILVLPWFFFACLLGLWGLTALARGGYKNLTTFCSIAGLMYLPVGCAWLLASRAGLSPLGFQEPIVLLTAVHFHFAGFAAPILAGATATALEKAKIQAWTVFQVIAIGVVCGPGLLAAGFVAGPGMKFIAALSIVASEVGLALFFLLAARKSGSRLGSVFIVLSSASVLFAMALVAIWAVGDFWFKPLVDLAAMARFHGTANAVGFTTCGLAGWTLSTQSLLRRKGGES